MRPISRKKYDKLKTHLNEMQIWHKEGRDVWNDTNFSQNTCVLKIQQHGFAFITVKVYSTNENEKKKTIHKTYSSLALCCGFNCHTPDTKKTINIVAFHQCVQKASKICFHCVTWLEWFSLQMSDCTSKIHVFSSSLWFTYQYFKSHIAEHERLTGG